MIHKVSAENEPQFLRCKCMVTPQAEPKRTIHKYINTHKAQLFYDQRTG